MPILFVHFLQPLANRFATSIVAEEYEFDLPVRSLASHASLRSNATVPQKVHGSTSKTLRSVRFLFHHKDLYQPSQTPSSQRPVSTITDAIPAMRDNRRDHGQRRNVQIPARPSHY